MEIPGGPVTKTAFFCASLMAVLVLLFAGCAANKQAIRPEYSTVLNKWTKGRKIFKGLESRLYINATYKDPTFREAYIDRYAESYMLEEPYRAALVEREREQAEKYNEFFMTAFTPVDRWNDFDEKDSVWKLYLEDSGGSRLSPVSITKVDASDPLVREFFPYLDLWSSGYVVRFPKYSEAGREPIPGPDTEFIRLVITGVLGEGELTWPLKEEP